MSDLKITSTESSPCLYYWKETESCSGQKCAPHVDCRGIVSRCELMRNNTISHSEHNSVNHPAHYNTGGVECIEGLAAATSGLEGIEAFCTANAIKYLWRWKWKNGVEDLDKAIWYINYLKAHLAKNN